MSLFRTLFGAYARHRIRKGLDGLWVRGLDTAKAVAAERPVVLAPTHVSWWDGMLLLALDDAFDRTTRAWMDAENLQKLPFFASLGAIPIDRSHPRAGIRAASDWLDRPGRLLWVFPQGRQRPAWLRPLELEGGARFIARRTGAALIPVGLNYGFRDAAVPSAVVSFGPPVPTDDLEGGLLQQLAHTEAFLAGNPGQFTALLGGAPVPHATVATRLLSLAARHG